MENLGLRLWLRRTKRQRDLGCARLQDNGGYALLRRTTRLLVNETMATPDNKTTSQRDNEWGGSRLWLRGAAPDNKTTSQRDN